MAWVHSQHVVHGDLKPANVLLDRGRAKIADFGMSRVRMDVSAPASGDAGMAGTVPFMAPECLAPSPPRKRKPADVYAYGMIAWEVAARGAEPFAGEDTQALVQNVPLGYRPPRPPDTPEALWRLITRCWAHLPSDRPEFQGIAEGVARMAAGLLDSAGH
ncbi:kinase-like domain-containing protein [Hyaloraphidium curvatum]|nr:kinase-like domain-containing protein [Hyaloraphidium curvatum]